MRRSSFDQQHSQDTITSGSGGGARAGAPNGWRFNENYEDRQMAYISKEQRIEVGSGSPSTVGGPNHSYFVTNNLTTDTHLAPTYGNSHAIKYYPRAPPNTPRPPSKLQQQWERYLDRNRASHEVSNLGESDEANSWNTLNFPKPKSTTRNPSLPVSVSPESQVGINHNSNGATSLKTSNMHGCAVRYPETRFDYSDVELCPRRRGGVEARGGGGRVKRGEAYQRIIEGKESPAAVRAGQAQSSSSATSTTCLSYDRSRNKSYKSNNSQVQSINNSHHHHHNNYHHLLGYSGLWEQPSLAGAKISGNRHNSNNDDRGRKNGGDGDAWATKSKR